MTTKKERARELALAKERRAEIRRTRDRAAKWKAFRVGPVPEGFTATWKDPDPKKLWEGAFGRFELKGKTGAAGSVEVTLAPYQYGVEVDGHQDGFYLGRTGVSGWESFEWENAPTFAGVVALLEKRKFDRAEFERTATRIKIGNSGWSLSPARLKQVRAELANGKAITFRPSGFGTGYVVSPRRVDTRYGGGTVLDADTLKVLGQDRLWFQTIDCD